MADAMGDYGMGEEGLWLWEDPDQGFLFSGPTPWKMAAFQRPTLKVSRVRRG